MCSGRRLVAGTTAMTPLALAARRTRERNRSEVAGSVGVAVVVAGLVGVVVLAVEVVALTVVALMVVSVAVVWMVAMVLQRR